MEIDDKIIQEEIEDHFELQTADQLQAISDPIRYRMILLLREKAMTGAQLSRALGLSRARAHYYLKTLVDSGLVRFRGDRLDNGLIGKYYRTIASYFSYDHLADRGYQMDPTDPEAIKIYKAINDFAITLLETSRSDMKVSEELARAYHFNLDTSLTEEQYKSILNEIRTIVNHLLAIKHENLHQHNQNAPLNFRTTILFTPIPKNLIQNK
ncbi:MAG: winged helix-turn-helix domain-containing protein [Chloroflexi bacterium]|nr:winged helix-turn-helix domain-containing protein [Chloroflexota bacterium]